jgi:Flp pilus assembly protein TadG
MTRTSAGRSAARLLRSRDGASALELALLTPLLLLLMVGVFDFGSAIVRKMQLNNAASVGAQYAILDDRDADALLQAISNATQLAGGDLSIATARVCECLDGRVVTCSSPDSCGVGARRRFFLEVSVTSSFATFFDYPAMDNPLALTGRSRIQVE